MTNDQKDLRKLIEDQEKIIKAAKYKISQITERHIPEDVRMFEEIGTWECDKSPFGICAYHGIEDSAHDSCIFCGEPDERK